MSNEAAERLREWPQLHAILRDYGSIPSDALTVLAAEAHERSAGAAPIDVDVLKRAVEIVEGWNFDLRALDWSHVPCGLCPRCGGKDHCESLIGGPGEADHARCRRTEQ